VKQQRQPDKNTPYGTPLQGSNRNMRQESEQPVCVKPLKFKIVSIETVDFSINHANNCTKGLSVCYFILPLRPQTKKISNK